MNKVLLIAGRELAAFFNSLAAYLMLIAFLGFCGFFTWVSGGGDIFFRSEASLGTFFSFSAYWSLLFFIPALTMRMLAEEKKTGTLELLLTKAVSDRQVIAGKFLGAFGLIAIALVMTLPYVITVAWLGDIDLGATLCGYLALMLLSAAYIGIGMFASGISDNQIVGFLLSLMICLMFHILFDVISFFMSGLPGAVMNYFSARAHFDSMSRGLIDLQDVAFFVSIAAMGLFLAELSLAKRNAEN